MVGAQRSDQRDALAVRVIEGSPLLEAMSAMPLTNPTRTGILQAARVRTTRRQPQPGLDGLGSKFLLAMRTVAAGSRRVPFLVPLKPGRSDAERQAYGVVSSTKLVRRRLRLQVRVAALGGTRGSLS